MTTQKNLRTGTSYWRSLSFAGVGSQALTSDKTADVIVIGAGITGAMAAEELSAKKLKVILIDRRGPLKGSTSATTALLQYEIDTPLSLLQKQIGYDRAARAWKRSRLGLESLAAKLQSLGHDCDYKRASSLYLAGNVLNADGLRLEQQMRNHIGLYTDYYSGTQMREHFGIQSGPALRAYDNVMVNPLKMAAGFLKRAVENKAEIYAPVVAKHIETNGSACCVYTEDGYCLTAKYLVCATGYEVPLEILTSQHSISSTYAIVTGKQAKKLYTNECMIWEASDPYLYIRPTADGRVICGGEDEDFKDEKKRDALLKAKTRILERKLKTLIPALDTTAEFAWCGSFGTTKTGLPTIGRIPGTSNCFAILAFGGNGITYSRIAAEIIGAEIDGKPDPDAGLFAF